MLALLQLPPFFASCAFRAFYRAALLMPLFFSAGRACACGILVVLGGLSFRDGSGRCCSGCEVFLARVSQVDFRSGCMSGVSVSCVLVFVKLSLKSSIFSSSLALFLWGVLSV